MIDGTPITTIIRRTVDSWNLSALKPGLYMFNVHQKNGDCPRLLISGYGNCDKNCFGFYVSGLLIPGPKKEDGHGFYYKTISPVDEVFEQQFIVEKGITSVRDLEHFVFGHQREGFEAVDMEDVTLYKGPVCRDLPRSLLGVAKKRCGMDGRAIHDFDIQGAETLNYLVDQTSFLQQIATDQLIPDEWLYAFSFIRQMNEGENFLRERGVNLEDVARYEQEMSGKRRVARLLQ